MTTGRRGDKWLQVCVWCNGSFCILLSETGGAATGTSGSLSATLAMAVAAAMGSVHHPVPGISWEAWIKHQCGRYMIICLRFPPDIFPAFNVALQVHFETYCISRDAIRGVLGYQSWLIRWRRWQRPWLRHWMFFFYHETRKWASWAEYHVQLHIMHICLRHIYLGW